MPRPAKPKPAGYKPPPVPAHADTVSQLRDSLAATGTGLARLAVLDRIIEESAADDDDELSAADALAAIVGGDFPQFGPVTIAKMQQAVGVAD